jgi:DNA invertase Pin-like site-specific DNA recombinase
MATKAFGYVRVSSGSQLQGHGPQRQKDDIAAFCKRNDLVLQPQYDGQAFFEDAYTGTESERPAWIAMMDAMVSSGVETVVVESLDRLARDLAVQMQLLAKLLGDGCTLVSVNTGDRLSRETLDGNPMLKAMVQIQGVFAELDKQTTVRRLRKARVAKANEAIATGKTWREGRHPYGLLNDQEAETLKRIKQLARKPRGEKRRSMAQIAKVLNSENRPARYAARWNPGSVWAVLQNTGKSKTPAILQTK